jgi:ribosome-binding protein aMBF1 (putative translation factor)
MSMITGVQIRSARSALQWSADELALKADVATKTVRRLENIQGIPNTTVVTLAKIQTVLEAAGIEFVGTPDDGPGIRVRPAR